MLGSVLIVLIVLFLLYLVLQFVLTWYGVKLIEENDDDNEPTSLLTRRESVEAVTKRRLRLLAMTVFLFILAILAALGIRWALKKRKQIAARRSTQ